MKMYRGEIKEFYEAKAVAEEYIRTRFTRPLGKVQHTRQVQYLNEVIQKRGVQDVLEIACGPARLTAEVKGFESGYAVDNSKEMLKIAEERVDSDSNWTFYKQDAFDLDLGRRFDLAYSFRFIRHFEKVERGEIYRQIRKVLKDDGLLIFDAVCYRFPGFSVSHKTNGKPKIYDKIYRDEQELSAELEQSGFSLIEAEGCIKHFYVQAFLSRASRYLNLETQGFKAIEFLERFDTIRPAEWIVLCKKSG